MKLYRPVRLAWPLAAAFVLLTGPARADVISEPPDDCPPGSEGGSSHCGAECYALVCTNDDDCPNGTTCQSTKACLRVVDCFPEPKHVHGGACSPGDICSGVGETCQAIDLCLPSGETSSGGSETGTSSASSDSSTSTASTTSTSTSTSGDGTSTTSSTTSPGSTSTTSTSTGDGTSTTSSGTSTTSTSTTTPGTSNGSTEATPTTGGQPGTTSSGTSSSTSGGTGSNTAGGGSGDKGGCAGCHLADGPHGLLALLVLVGVRRRRPRRPVPKAM